MIIAVDGPAASGKGTLGRLIAKHYGLRYLDTGSLYRAVARDCLAKGVDIYNAQAAAAAALALDPSSLEDPHLRDPGIGEAASIVAGFVDVRRALLAFQHKIARSRPGAVLDGRDIGTVVCPDADAKIFVNAKVEIRAQRRYLELRNMAKEDLAEPVTQEAVLEMIRRRDERDRRRASSPLHPAEDAYLLETSDLSIEAAFDAAIRWIERKIGRSGNS